MFATLRRFALGLCIALSPLPAAAACQGRDLLATLPGPERAALEAAVAAQPFAVGNHWRATRGGSTIHVIGTFHMFDARMTMHMRKLMPVLHQAGAIYLEATEKEMAELQAAMASRPELMFTTGPTLPERLTDFDGAYLLTTTDFSAGMMPKALNCCWSSICELAVTTSTSMPPTRSTAVVP